MAQDIKADEIKEVLSFIDRISIYDKRYFNRLQQINGLIWGLLFIGGGILDFTFYSIDQGQLSGLPWAIASIIGITLSLYINTGNPKEITSKDAKKMSKNINRVYKIVLALTVFSWIFMTIIIALFDLYVLTMPIVALLLGITYTTALVKDGFKFELKKVLNLNYPMFFTPSTAFLAFVLTFTGYLINPDISIYSGLVVGTIVGLGFIISAIRYNRSSVGSTTQQ